MELNSLISKFKGKSNKFITVILIGILLLVIVLPVKNNNINKNTYVNRGISESGSSYADEIENVKNYDDYASYYENKLKNILEKSYGSGTMEVMVQLKNTDDNNNLYTGSYENSKIVDGVLIVANVKNQDAIADISFAVCALFDLPAHKVAVMIKN